MRRHCHENVNGNGVPDMMQNNSSETPVKVVLVQELPGKHLQKTRVTEQK
jgi:hypothetical protein